MVFDMLRMHVFIMGQKICLDPMLRATVFSNMTDCINGLNSTLGMLERLASTPLPFIYVAFLRVTIVGHLILVPLTLGMLSTTPYHTTPHHTTPCRTVPYRTIPYHTIPCHDMASHIRPYFPIPHHNT